MHTTQNLNGEIAGRVRVAAKQAGITHQALAPVAGVSRRTFTNLMAGTTDWKLVHIEPIAKALNVNPADLAFGRAA